MKKFIVGTLVATMLLSQSIFAGTVLSFNANATVEKAPDVAYFNTELKGTGSTNAEANEMLNKNLDEFTKAIVSADLGVEKEDILVNNYWSHPKYDYSKDETVLIGYEATYNLKLIIKNIDDIDLIIDEIGQFDSLLYSNLSYDLMSDDDLYEEALIEATSTAIAKAETIIDKFFNGYDYTITEIKESGTNYYEPIEYNAYESNDMLNKSEDSAYTTPQIKTTAYVNISVEVDN